MAQRNPRLTGGLAPLHELRDYRVAVELFDRAAEAVTMLARETGNP